MVITFRKIVVLFSFPWVFGSHANLSSMISAFRCFLEFPRKLPRAKPCSDPNRVREPGEVEFDIEVGACPVSSLLHIQVTEKEEGLSFQLGEKKYPVHSVTKIYIKGKIVC